MKRTQVVVARLLFREFVHFLSYSVPECGYLPEIRNWVFRPKHAVDCSIRFPIEWARRSLSQTGHGVYAQDQDASNSNAAPARSGSPPPPSCDDTASLRPAAGATSVAATWTTRSARSGSGRTLELLGSDPRPPFGPSQRRQPGGRAQYRRPAARAAMALESGISCAGKCDPTRAAAWAGPNWA